MSSMPVSLILAARKFIPALEKIAETRPEIILDDRTLKLPLENGESVVIHKDENLEIRSTRYSRGAGAPGAGIRAHGVVVDFIQGGETYRILGQGISREAEAAGIGVLSLV